MLVGKTGIVGREADSVDPAGEALSHYIHRAPLFEQYMPMGQADVLQRAVRCHVENPAKLWIYALWRGIGSRGRIAHPAERDRLWGQNLSLQPHIHCIVPAAGYAINGTWKNIDAHQNYLYPVHQLSGTFRGKFLDSLKRILRKCNMPHNFDACIQQAYQKPWVVFSEASMAKAEYVVRYLGQYTHRVAISNQRILKITDTHVTFIAKDYRDNAQQKPVTLGGVEFLRRFCLHVLPERFVKIRRYGIYNATTIRHLELQFVPEPKPDILVQQNTKDKETAQQLLKRLTGFDAHKCRICNEGTMQVIASLPRIRSPSQHLPSLLLMLMQ